MKIKQTDPMDLDTGSTTKKKRKSPPTQLSAPIVKKTSTSVPIVKSPPRIFKEFWNQSTREMSQNIWLPIKSDCVELDLETLDSKSMLKYSLHESSKRLMLDSWFTVKIQVPQTPLESSQMMYWQSLQSLLQKGRDLDQKRMEEKELLKATAILKRDAANKIRIQKFLDARSPEQIKEDNIVEEKQKKLRKLKLDNKQWKKDNLDDYMDPDDKDPAEKTMKIRVYPTQEQKIKLKQWFGAFRWIYNRCIAFTNEKKCKRNMADLRKKITNSDNFKTENQWCGKYHSDFREDAMLTFLKNVKSNQAKDKKYVLSFKSKNDRQSFTVRSKYWNATSEFWKEILSSTKMKTTRSKKRLDKNIVQLPDVIHYDGRFIKTVSGEYYITFPQPLEDPYVNDKGKKREESPRSIFIDPGVKNFITGFDPSGKIITWGKADMGRIARLIFYNKKLNSKISKCENYRKKVRLKKAFLKANQKIWYLTEELHKKLTLWLVKSYDQIYISRLDFHKCTNLSKREKHKMACYRHCGFLTRLMNKTREYTKTKVFEVFEDYTSKTCTCCGKVDKNLRNKNMYKCKFCKQNVERDITGSRNIMLRHLTLTLGSNTQIERPLARIATSGLV